MRERVRILHCLSSVAGGGVERRRLSLAKLLDPERYEQRVLARAVRGEVVSSLEQCGVPVATIGQGGLFAPQAMLRAAQEGLAFKPHIVHGAVFEGLSAALVAGRVSGARVVLEETSHAVNRSRKGHALFRALVAAADACVAISPAVADFLVNVTRIPPEKVEVINNGAEAPLYPTRERAQVVRDELGISPERFVVGTVARLMDDSHKRVSDLLRATARLSADWPELHLLVVGDGTERRMLERLAADLGIAARVTFAGHRDRVGELYALMDVFALVSAREGFGLVIVEAMLCGLPVVGTAVGGIPNIIVANETGLIVPPCNPDAIAVALDRLRRDDALRRAMGVAGKVRAARHFGAERYAADVDAFYQRLLSRPPRFLHRRPFPA